MKTVIVAKYMIFMMTVILIYSSREPPSWSGVTIIGYGITIKEGKI